LWTLFFSRRLTLARRRIFGVIYSDKEELPIGCGESRSWQGERRANGETRGMKKTIVALGALALAGCNAGNPDLVAVAPDAPTPTGASRDALNARIALHARAANIPESLIHRSVKRESNYNPMCKHGPYWGLMQIRYDTAKSMGYAGPASGLLDADTNLKFGVAYLANAWRLSGGDEKRAIRLYAGGYYFEAKRRGMLGEMRKAGDAAPGAETTPATAQTAALSESSR
jgi:soluble lytic murein transglycosylase-like protein